MSFYEIGPFQLDAQRLTLACRANPVALGRKVVETLLALAEHAGELRAKEALLDRVWPSGFVEEANLVQNVYVLRKTFRAFGHANPIETIPGYGYRLTCPVRRLELELPIPPKRRRPLIAVAAAAFAAAVYVLIAGGNAGQEAPPAHTLSKQGENLYQAGRYYWNLRTPAGIRASLGYFRQVVDTDPLNALGYAALADVNVTIGDYCYGTHRPEVYFARARAYANRALALNPSSAQAHAALGFVDLHVSDVDAGIAELRRAIALDPSYADAHEWYGIALLRRGQTSEGSRQLTIAANLDPLSVAAIAWLGSAAFLSRRFDDAIVYSREALELSPSRTDALRMIGEAYEAQGEFARAIAALKQYGMANSYYAPSAAALLARAYARSHRMMEARAQLALARARMADVDAIDLDLAGAAVGDRASVLGRTHSGHDDTSWKSLENGAHFGALARLPI